MGTRVEKEADRRRNIDNHSFGLERTPANILQDFQKMIYNGRENRNLSELSPPLMLKMLVSDDHFRAQSQRLAIARLKHRVNEMETRVEHDRRLLPPTKKIFDCVVDDTALTSGLVQLKRWIARGSIHVTIPFSTLQTLDRLKKGTETENVNAREAIRYIERAGAGPKKLQTMDIQTYMEKFAAFEDCEIYAKKINPQSQTDDSILLTLQSLSLSDNNRRRRSPEREGERENRPSKETEAILNCALFRMRKLSSTPEPREFMLVSNDPQVVAWARYYGIRSVSVGELAAFIADEEAAFANRQRQYQLSNGSGIAGRENHNGSPGRGRGGRGGYTREITVSPRALDRNDGSFTFTTPKSPTSSFGGGRGRGGSNRTLWEPK